MNKTPLMLPFPVKIPQEISLAQLWHRHVANRVKRHIEVVKWGKHFRGSSEVEEGQVSDLQDKDSVEIIIPAEPAPAGQLEVVYNLEGETVVNRLTVKSTATMGDVRARISMAHKGKPIEALSFEGATLAEEDNFSDWMFRSGGMPRQLVAKIQPMVQVVVDYMGVEKQMTVRKVTSKTEFLSQAKAFLATSHNLDVIAHIPGNWEIRAGSTYEIREVRQLTLRCKDQDNRDFAIKIQGTKNIEDVQELCRQYWGYGPWIKIAISRLDGKQFFLQDGALYSVAATYDPALDPRPEVTLRIDLRDWSYFIPKFRVEDDPVQVLKTLKSKYGFPLDKPSQVQFSSGPWISGQTVCVTVSAAISCAKVTLPQFYRRTFSLFIADEPWESGEVILPREYGKEQIWAHLQTLHPISDVTQFQVVANRKEISGEKFWPAGHIEAIPVKFPVSWHIENPRSPNGVYVVKHEELTPLLTAQAAWGLLRNDVPNLLEEPIIEYRGFLKPGLTYNVTIPRENVRVSVSFEVFAKGCITFAQEVLPNMITWHEIYAHFSSIDQRICPWENYIDEELRPYLSETPLHFRLNSSLEIPDTTHNFGGVSGGQTSTGHVLPPIVFPKPSVNTASPADPKVQGSVTGQLAAGSDSSSDSWEEELFPETISEEERLAYQAMADEHKLRKMRQATIKGVPITVEIGAAYVYGGQIHGAVFSNEFKISQPPAHVLEPFQIAYKQIEQIGLAFQGGLPASSIWADSGIPREEIDITVFKIGQGIYLRYACSQEEALDMRNLPEQIKALLPLDWSVSFSTTSNPVDLELTERMANITSQVLGNQFHSPWQVHLAKTQLRIGELGTPGASVYKMIGKWDDYRQVEQPPVCAKEIPTFVEATTVKESQAMLRFGRDSNWPIKITLAARASPAMMVSITYDTDWEGLHTTEEGEISTDWGWTKFNAKFKEEALLAPPALASGTGVWNASIRKENNSFRIILKEAGIWAPEDPDGPPPMILFGPKAVVKIRTTAEGPVAMLEMREVLRILYQGRYEIEREVPSREWALIGSFGGGEIPMHYLLDPPEISLETMTSGNGAILEAALKTQNYDKGFDKFIRKFDPSEEMSALVSVEEGFQGDHGWSVAFQQGPRRCLLLDTTDGLSKEESMWLALSAWATFEPRHKSRRQVPGTLYYPDEASHIFQDFWDHLGNLPEAPGFDQCSLICQQCMTSFSEALGRYDCNSWETLPVADAPEKLARIGKNAAISRVRPIADGQNQWDMHRSSAATVCQSSLGAAMVGTESGSTTGLTGMCAAQGSPLNTGGAISLDG
jgi:hypothetical protein